MCRTVARSSASCPWYFSSSCGTESSLDGLCSLYSCRISRAMPSTLPATSPAGSAARAQPSASSRRTTPSRAILGGTPINGVFCSARSTRGVGGGDTPRKKHASEKHASRGHHACAIKRAVRLTERESEESESHLKGGEEAAGLLLARGYARWHPPASCVMQPHQIVPAWRGATRHFDSVHTTCYE